MKWLTTLTLFNYIGCANLMSDMSHPQNYCGVTSDPKLYLKPPHCKFSGILGIRNETPRIIYLPLPIINNFSNYQFTRQCMTTLAWIISGVERDLSRFYVTLHSKPPKWSSSVKDTRKRERGVGLG